MNGAFLIFEAIGRNFVGLSPMTQGIIGYGSLHLSCYSIYSECAFLGSLFVLARVDCGFCWV
jgi:hypothetical protein